MTAPGVTALVVSAGVLVVLGALGWQIVERSKQSDVAPGADVAGSLKSLQEKRLDKTEKNQQQAPVPSRDATVRP